MPQVSYKCLDQFVFRVPLLPVNFTDTDFILGEVFKEALYIASPDLYNALNKHPGQPYNNLPEKTKLSLLKYFSRMRTRCTPFGLFAGCAAGTLGERAAIRIKGLEDFRSYTRLDMTYLCALSEKVAKLTDIQDDLILYLNDSLYRINNAYRYIEHRYVNGERKYYLSEVPDSPTLDAVFTGCGNGAKGISIKEVLAKQGHDQEDVNEYFNFLINNQLLVNNLYPSVTGPNDLLQKMITQISFTLPELLTMKEHLISIRDILTEMDEKELGRGVTYYIGIEEHVKSSGISYNSKYLFQSDMSVNASIAKIDQKVLDTAVDGFEILNKLSRKNQSKLLKKFRDDFYDRYEEEEVPLNEALDPDIGIGFGKLRPGNVSINQFADGLAVIGGEEPQRVDNSGQHIDDLLMKKYHAFLQEKTECIEISDEDVKHFPASVYTDLPNTMCSMVDVIKAGNRSAPLINMAAVTGSSAANLLGRFCHINKGIHKIVDDIVAIEDNLVKENEILAEIVHLPQARTGNILFRPAIRKYEIPYLASNSVDEVFRVPVSDLMLSAGREGLRLRSKRLNKYILPRLTTAHNFMNRSLPVYSFLATLQEENCRNFLIFSWGKLAASKHLPRVIYKNVILSPAIWNFNPTDVAGFTAPGSTDFLQKINAFREAYQIPSKVTIVQGDNKLYIDLDDELLLKLFYTETFNKSFKLEEFLFDDEDPLIKSEDEKMFYANEVLLFFKREIEK
jgi:lantibiotic biosynthesis protein